MIFDLGFRVFHDELAEPVEVAFRLPDRFTAEKLSVSDLCQAYARAISGKRSHLAHYRSEPILMRLLEELPRS